VIGSGVPADELRQILDRSGGSSIDEAAVSCESVYANPVAGATAGIWRMRSANGWSAIVKVLRDSDAGSPNWQSGATEDHWFYWKREATAYQSGALDGLSGRLRAARCFGVFDRPDGSAAVWLEDLGSARPAADWSMDRYREAAFALGVAQARYTRPLDDAWMAHRFLRRYVDRRQDLDHLIGDDAAWKGPLVSRYLLPLRDQIAELRRTTNELVAVVESGPTTLCHLDLHPGNLFAVGDETVLIDWAFVGPGSIGEDVGSLIFDAVLDFFVSPDALIDLERGLSDGYLDGLRAAQWHGSVDSVLGTIAAAGAAKFSWIPLAMVDAEVNGRQLVNRRAIAETFEWCAPLIPRLIERGGIS
jgi:hypothetical protein